MDNTYTLNGNIIVELGGMQITKEQIDAVKVARQKDTDQEAVNYLIQVAESAFSREVEACEYLAEIEEGGDPYEIVSPDEHLSAAYCDAIKK